MSNKQLSGFFLILLFIGIISGCKSEISKKTISADEVNKILQEFTEARIGQYIYSDESPKDNITILIRIAKSHGYDYSDFLKALKDQNKAVYNKLFPNQSDK